MRSAWWCLFILLLLNFGTSLAQNSDSTDLKDSSEKEKLGDKISEYFFKNTDSTLKYSLILLSISKEEEDYKTLNFALQMCGECYRSIGDFPNALKMELRALRLSQSRNDKKGEAYISSFIGFNYAQAGMYDKALEYLLPTLRAMKGSEESIQYSFISSNAAYCYIKKKKADSAQFFNQQSLRIFDAIHEESDQKRALRTLILDRFGNFSESFGQLEEAARYYRASLYYAFRDSILMNVSHIQASIANILRKQGQYDSALFYARSAIAINGRTKENRYALEVDSVMAAIFHSKGLEDSAITYRLLAMNLKDRMFGIDMLGAFMQLTLDEQMRSQTLEAEKVQLRSRLRISLVAVIGAAFLGFALIMLRNNRAKQKTNLQLKEQKEDLEDALSKLKSTQTQLVRSEKMASLGELTAGIAHEIQNPLNFVNNFSELNRELVADLNTEIQKGNLDAARQIANDLASNEEKINEHGKRADSIVKGMLQHSRSSAGVKEPVDINALCDEYLRLCYHGFRAKEKNFNVSIETHFDSGLSKAELVPQDIGRVLLNVCNNAFYALNKKLEKGLAGYQPTVTISTKGLPSHKIEIRISDNGTGIPEKLKEKIFQPFFTTKPTGQGTGLGLSLSYDIVKAHGGDIEVKSKEGEGSEFIIQIQG